MTTEYDPQTGVSKVTQLYSLKEVSLSGCNWRHCTSLEWHQPFPETYLDNYFKDLNMESKEYELLPKYKR